VPCARLSRATFIPALINLSIIAVELVAGPMVHTIFVRLEYNLDRLITFPYFESISASVAFIPTFSQV